MLGFPLKMHSLYYVKMDWADHGHAWRICALLCGALRSVGTRKHRCSENRSLRQLLPYGNFDFKTSV